MTELESREFATYVVAEIRYRCPESHRLHIRTIDEGLRWLASCDAYVQRAIATPQGNAIAQYFVSNALQRQPQPRPALIQ